MTIQPYIWTRAQVKEQSNSKNELVQEWAHDYQRVHFPADYITTIVNKLMTKGFKLDHNAVSLLKESGKDYLNDLQSGLTLYDENYWVIAEILAHHRLPNLPEQIMKHISEGKLTTISAEHFIIVAGIFQKYDTDFARQALLTLYIQQKKAGAPAILLTSVMNSYLTIATPATLQSGTGELIKQFAETADYSIIKPLLQFINDDLHEFLFNDPKSDTTTFSTFFQSYCEDSAYTFNTITDDADFKELTSLIDGKKQFRDITTSTISAIKALCESRNIDLVELTTLWTNNSLTNQESLDLVKAVYAIEIFNVINTEDSNVSKLITSYAISAYITLFYKTPELYSTSSEYDLNAITHIVASEPNKLFNSFYKSAAAHGMQLIPRLQPFIKLQGEQFWAQINATEILARISKELPETCSQLADAIIDELNEDCTEYFADAASDLLSNMYSHCKSKIIAASSDADHIRSLYTSNVLTKNIDAEDIAIIIEKVNQKGFIDEDILSTLKRLANPDTLSILDPHTDDYAELEALLTIVEVHNTDIEEHDEIVKKYNTMKKRRESMSPFEMLGMRNPFANQPAEMKSKLKAKPVIKTSGADVLKRKQALNKKKKKKKRK